MKRVPLFFISAFLADGLLSLAIIAAPSLLLLQQLVAWLVLLSAILLHLLMAVNRRLPKRLLLPATVFTLLSLPLSLIFINLAVPVLPLAQTILGAVLFFAIKYSGPKAKLEGSFFSLPNFSAMVGVNLALVGCFFALLVLSGLSFVENKTAGFVKIGTEGISIQERWFQRDDGKSVRLIGMVHIAKDQFYDDLQATLPDKESTIVLLEGITDKGSLLQKKLSYSNVAQTLGLSSQTDSEFMKTAAKNSYDPADSPKTLKNKLNELKVRYWRADVDTSDFQVSTIDCLEAVGNLFASKDLGEVVENLTDPTSPLNQEADNKTFLYDVIEMRNEHLIKKMKDALEHCNVVVVPWGALHMPVFEQKLKEWGFKETHRTSRLAFSFQPQTLAQVAVKP